MVTQNKIKVNVNRDSLEAAIKEILFGQLLTYRIYIDIDSGQCWANEYISPTSWTEYESEKIHELKKYSAQRFEDMLSEARDSSKCEEAYANHVDFIAEIEADNVTNYDAIELEIRLNYEAKMKEYETRLTT